MLGPYIKSRGTRAPKCQQTQTSSQWRHMYNKGKQFENHFFIYGPKYKKKCIFWGYFGGPEGVFNDQTKPILLSSYPLENPYINPAPNERNIVYLVSYLKIKCISDPKFFILLICDYSTFHTYQSRDYATFL